MIFSFLGIAGFWPQKKNCNSVSLRVYMYRYLLHYYLIGFPGDENG